MRSIFLAIASAGLAGCVAPPIALRPPTEQATAPGPSGVYVTAEDFQRGHLTDALRCESASKPIDADAFSRSRDVIMPGNPTARRKADVFGFHACDGTDVRFVGGANYRVVGAPPLYLYQHQYRVSAGRSSRLVTEHFFGTTAADSVRPLTIDALKRAYPDNHRFHDLLDLAFRGDAELTRYDEFHHEYRVARLLRESLDPAPGRR